MNINLKAALIGATFGILAFVASSLIAPQHVHAAGLDSREQYKVVDTPAPPTVENLEIILNQLSEQGWKLRTSCATMCILAK